MRRAKLKLSTRYRYLLRDAKVMTVMLELAAAKLLRAGRRIDGKDEDITGSDCREMSSECTRIAHQCGRLPRRRVPR